MAQEKILPANRGERGQSIILVAVCIVSLLAMAALAVDVVTLYVAKGEIQHAADAAALAGAKAFVESTVTTDPSNAGLQTLAQNIACPDAACSSGYIAQALTQNPVSGSPAVINPSSPVTYDFTNHLGNPRITVNLQRTGLPIFFARIWSSNLVSVSATATAEAYNASNSQTNNGSLIPIAPQCVKPILVRNKTHGGISPVPQFINTNDGTIFAPGNVNSGGLIGVEMILRYAPSCATTSTPSCVRYKPAQVPSTHNFCSSSCSVGTNYEQSIECCDGSVYDVTQCGDAAQTWALQDPANNAGGSNGPTQSATQCLIHASGPGAGNGQDSLDTSGFLSSNNPMQIKAGAYSSTEFAVAADAPITTSDSIITLPIYDDTLPITSNNQVTIVGFLQVFVNFTDSVYGDLDVTILNVIGCGSNPPSAVPAISGGGISPVPVRLITPGG